MPESIVVTGAIKANNRWDVAIMDLAGAFLHATNVDNVIMIMTGKLAEFMVIYLRYIIANKKGEPMLNMHMHKALYNMLKSASLISSSIHIVHVW